MALSKKEKDFYVSIARKSDEITELLMKECSRGSEGVFYKELYNALVPVVIEQVLKSPVLYGIKETL